jgi:hypothetical protein
MLKERIKFVSVCDFKHCSIYRYFLMPLHFSFIVCAIGRNPLKEGFEGSDVTAAQTTVIAAIVNHRASSFCLLIY